MRTLRNVPTCRTDSGSITNKIYGERHHRSLWSTTTERHAVGRPPGQDRFPVAGGKQKWTLASAVVPAPLLKTTSVRRMAATSAEEAGEETIDTANDSEQTALDQKTTERRIRNQSGCSTSPLHRRISKAAATASLLTSRDGRRRENLNPGD